MPNPPMTNLGTYQTSGHNATYPQVGGNEETWGLYLVYDLEALDNLAADYTALKAVALKSGQPITGHVYFGVAGNLNSFSVPTYLSSPAGLAPTWTPASTYAGSLALEKNSGQLFIFNGTSWAATTAAATLAGDVSGPLLDTVVTALNSVPIDTGPSPADGQVLTYDGTTHKWKPAVAVFSRTPFGSGGSADGSNAVVLTGYDGAASGDSAVSLTGDNAQALGNFSVAIGSRAVASRDFEFAQAGGNVFQDGDAQTSVIPMRASGAGAQIFVMGGASKINIGENRACLYQISAIGRKAGVAVAAFKAEGIIERPTGGSVSLSANSVTAVGTTPTDWSFDVSADTTNNALQLTGTSPSGVLAVWSARVTLTQVGG